MLEKILESPLNGHDIKPVNPKGNQSWIFFVRTEAEAPIHWPLDAESTHWKKPDAGDWRQEKGTIEDGMIGWHHWLNGHEFEQTLGDGEGQGSLTCCSPWGPRVRQDWATEQQQERVFPFSLKKQTQKGQGLNHRDRMPPGQVFTALEKPVYLRVSVYVFI